MLEAFFVDRVGTHAWISGTHFEPFHRLQLEEATTTSLIFPRASGTDSDLLSSGSTKEMDGHTRLLKGSLIEEKAPVSRAMPFPATASFPLSVCFARPNLVTPYTFCRPVYRLLSSG
jgi:hypothetical protein